MRPIDCNHIFVQQIVSIYPEKKKDGKHFKTAENCVFVTIWPSVDMPVPISVACLKCFSIICETNTV